MRSNLRGAAYKGRAPSKSNQAARQRSHNFPPGE